jgi:hypothetical protein
MSHHATNNWGNTRKNPDAGISQGPHEHNRNQVKALLCGNEDEAITFIRRHSVNESFLRLAEELETARTPQRPTALKLIQQFRKNLSERTIA